MLVFVLPLVMTACAMASDVMDTGNGTYMISAHAAPVRGGAAGANQVAYADANAFCQKQGTHAVVLAADSRDVYQSSFASSYQGGFGFSGGSGGGFAHGSAFGGAFAAGNADLHFRCDK